jgi:hypothetical protein
MTFTEITKNPIILPTNQLCEFLNIERTEVDFFKLIEKQFKCWEFWQYTNFGHYVSLCNGMLELYSDGYIEVREYNFSVPIFKIVKMFSLQGIELTEINSCT